MRDELTSLKNLLDSEKSCSNTSEVQDLKKQLLEMGAERNKEDTSTEITQMNIRRNNLISFNILESKSEDPNSKKTLDQESFLQLCREELKLDDIEVVAVTRLHANSNSESTEKEKIKPLRIKLKTEQMRTLFPSKAKMLAKSENQTFKNIYLKRVATPLERAEMKRRKENRKRKECKLKQPCKYCK